MKSVLWNELRMVTKCVTPFDRLIRINPELVPWCPLVPSSFSNAKNPAMLWSNLLFIYKKDFLVHVAVWQADCFMTRKENSLFLSLFSTIDITKGGWNIDFKICSAHSSAIVVRMKLCVSFFKISYLVDATFLKFDHIFFYQFIENAWMGSEII
jgi:hypothetical protein